MWGCNVRVQVVRSLWWVCVWLIVLPTALYAEPPRSILVLNESAMVGPFYRGVYDALRSSLYAHSSLPTSIFMEQLERERFGDARHEQAFRAYLQSKYRDQPLGVIVAFGVAALDFVLRLQTEMWSGVPVVFVMVDETALRRLSIPPTVTGRTARVKFRDLVSAAYAVQPNLQRLAIVGDSWEKQTAFRHFKDEIPASSPQMEIIDLMGLPMRELRRRVAALPERTVVVYTSIFSDGEGTSYPPVEALGYLSQSANRPIVVPAETFVGRGGIGGYVLTPAAIGKEAAELALRILSGENPSAIPISEGNVVRPIFDWRQLQRWGVSDSQLPEGSEVRFRELTAWERYRWQLTAILVALLAQSVIISWLFIERRDRRSAELVARARLSEVIHLNRTAEAGALSASFAHELSQPLEAIALNAASVEHLLETNPPDLIRAKTNLVDLRQANEHAAQIIQRLKKLLKRNEPQQQEFDLNEAIADAMRMLSPEATKRRITLSAESTRQRSPVRADRIHVQQVILNLAGNAMDAMVDAPADDRAIIIRTALAGDSEVEVSVSDSGTGIPEHKLCEIFNTFYTTKKHGTGLGLSIARTIVETYGGRMSAENRPEGGAVFRFTLPLLRPV